MNHRIVIVIARAISPVLRPMAIVSTPEASAMMTSHGVRRPNRERVRSESAPPVGRAVIDATAANVVSSARTPTFESGASCATCAGSRITPIPLNRP